MHSSLLPSLHQRVSAPVQHGLKSQSSSTLPLLARHWTALVRVDSSLCLCSVSMCEMHRKGWQSQTYLGFANSQRICLPSIHAILHTNFLFQLLVRCPAKLFSPPQSAATTRTPHLGCCLSARFLLAESQEAFSYFYSYHKNHLICLII